MIGNPSASAIASMARNSLGRSGTSSSRYDCSKAGIAESGMDGCSLVEDRKGIAGKGPDWQRERKRMNCIACWCGDRRESSTAGSAVDRTAKLASSGLSYRIESGPSAHNDKKRSALPRIRIAKGPGFVGPRASDRRTGRRLTALPHVGQSPMANVQRDRNCGCLIAWRWPLKRQAVVARELDSSASIWPHEIKRRVGPEGRRILSPLSCLTRYARTRPLNGSVNPRGFHDHLPAWAQQLESVHQGRAVARGARAGQGSSHRIIRRIALMLPSPS
jgi:hypothetical protein